jgi:hypothetical protein
MNCTLVSFQCVSFDSKKEEAQIRSPARDWRAAMQGLTPTQDQRGAKEWRMGHGWDPGLSIGLFWNKGFVFQSKQQYKAQDRGRGEDRGTKSKQNGKQGRANHSHAAGHPKPKIWRIVEDKIQFTKGLM